MADDPSAKARRAELAEIFTRDRTRLLAVAHRVLRDPVDAEDALQDALVSACRRLDAFRGDSRLSTWLHRIVFNAALMRLRKRRRLAEGTLEAVPAPPEPEPTPEEQLARREIEAALGDCVEALPGDYRDVLVWRYVDELPCEAIALRTGISSGGIKTRAHRARLALRDRLALRLRETAPRAAPSPAALGQAG